MQSNLLIKVKDFQKFNGLLIIHNSFSLQRFNNHAHLQVLFFFYYSLNRFFTWFPYKLKYSDLLELKLKGNLS